MPDINTDIALLEQRTRELESKVSALHTLKVWLNVVVVIAGIFGISAAALLYRLWAVFPYISTGKMEVTIQSKQFPNKLLSGPSDEVVKIDVFDYEKPDRWHRWIIRSAPPEK